MTKSQLLHAAAGPVILCANDRAPGPIPVIKDSSSMLLLLGPAWSKATCSTIRILIAYLRKNTPCASPAGILCEACCATSMCTKARHSSGTHSQSNISEHTTHQLASHVPWLPYTCTWQGPCASVHTCGGVGHTVCACICYKLAWSCRVRVPKHLGLGTYAAAATALLRLDTQ